MAPSSGWNASVRIMPADVGCTWVRMSGASADGDDDVGDDDDDADNAAVVVVAVAVVVVVVVVIGMATIF